MSAGTGRPEKSGVPLGTGSPDEPAHTLPAEPAQITRVGAASSSSSPSSAGSSRSPKNGPGKSGQGAAAGAPRKQPDNDEPELALEPDLPSDGRDEKGEAMIRDLPRRPELSEAPSRPRSGKKGK